MGLCASSNGTEHATAEQKQQDKKVKAQLVQSRLKDLYHFKILVLGEGESGKSTCVKHTKLLYQKLIIGEEEAAVTRDSLLTNVYDCVQSVARASKTLSMPFPSEFDDFMNIICDEKLDKSVMPRSNYENILRLIKCEHFQTVLEQRTKYWILDNADYYLKNVERFYDPSFVPTEDDFLVARAKTTGIVETTFSVENVHSKSDFDHHVEFLVVDVGGQRSERRKWMHVFDSVRAVLYFVNLAGYSMVLYEDESKNRMTEALDLFRESSKTYFKDLPVFLVLNKRDLFDKALEKTPLNQCFPDYTGSNDTKECVDFIASKFQAALPVGSPPLKTYVVSAHSQSDVQEMFQDVTSSLITMNSSKLDAEADLIRKELEV
eukprot:TRINITY_DN20680_c0_g1_i1.p1 TRINITY_DN20680_c0_g1~~TRINITY_DN20680_c0_g1_i1.p1  ORF type:complete len:376 (-),score=77.60 TRINITY_DN20680_c0_g1_i1:169-1296(-)